MVLDERRERNDAYEGALKLRTLAVIASAMNASTSWGGTSVITPHLSAQSSIVAM